MTSVPSRRHKAAVLLCTLGASTACFVSFHQPTRRSPANSSPKPQTSTCTSPQLILERKLPSLDVNRYVCPTPDYPAQLSKAEACSDQKTTLTYAQPLGQVITIAFPYPLPCSGQVFTSIPPTLVQTYQLPSSLSPPNCLPSSHLLAFIALHPWPMGASGSHYLALMIPFIPKLLPMALIL